MRRFFEPQGRASVRGTTEAISEKVFHCWWVLENLLPI